MIRCAILRGSRAPILRKAFQRRYAAASNPDGSEISKKTKEEEGNVPDSTEPAPFKIRRLVVAKEAPPWAPSSILPIARLSQNSSGHDAAASNDEESAIPNTIEEGGIVRVIRRGGVIPRPKEPLDKIRFIEGDAPAISRIPPIPNPTYDGPPKIRFYSELSQTANSLQNSAPTANLSKKPATVVWKPIATGGRSYSTASRGSMVQTILPNLDIDSDIATDSREAVRSKQDAPDIPQLPFITDPNESKWKFYATKSRPSKDPTPFQLKLLKNPYAQALASPVRTCPATNTRLPTFFMQRFKLMAHPENNEPWWMPMNLDPFQKRTESARGTSDRGEEPAATKIDIDLEESHDVPLEITPVDSQLSIQEKLTPRIGRSTYLLSRQDLLQAILGNESGYGNLAWRRLFMSPDLAQLLSTRKIIENSNWRSDLDTFILELMRRRIADHLEDLVSLKRGYISSRKSWDEVSSSSRQVGAILWTGYPDEESLDVCIDAPQRHGPLEFATLGIKLHDSKTFGVYTSTPPFRERIPVHNLRRLLGRDHLELLRAKSMVFKQEILVLKDKLVTTDLQLKLWKLQGYQARFDDFMTLEEAKEFHGKMLTRRSIQPGSEPKKELKLGGLAVKRIQLDTVEEELGLQEQSKAIRRGTGKPNP